jgi:hypothetical protein
MEPGAFWLHMARNAPVIDVERVVLDIDGQPVEVSRIVTPSRYPFHRFILSSHGLISRHLWSASFVTDAPRGAILLSGWRRQDILGSKALCT